MKYDLKQNKYGHSFKIVRTYSRVGKDIHVMECVCGIRGNTSDGKTLTLPNNVDLKKLISCMHKPKKDGKLKLG